MANLIITCSPAHSGKTIFTKAMCSLIPDSVCIDADCCYSKKSMLKEVSDALSQGKTVFVNTWYRRTVKALEKKIVMPGLTIHYLSSKFKPVKGVKNEA